MGDEKPKRSIEDSSQSESDDEEQSKRSKGSKGSKESKGSKVSKGSKASKESKDDGKSNINRVEFAENVKSTDGSDINPLEDPRFDFLRRISEGSSSSKRRRRQVFFAFKARQRPRQPFMNQADLNQASSAPPITPPRPPPYYVSQVTPDQHRPDVILSNEGRNASRTDNYSTALQPSPQSASIVARPSQTPQSHVVSSQMPQHQPGGMAMISNPLFNFAYWAPYPDSVPPNVTPCLAHLYQADSLFIVQQINVLELLMFSYVNVPNFYLIQNKNGHVIYYVYETTDLCMTTCCSSKRGFQLHVMDIYNNEVIYMNRPCGCSNFPCCYPVMEVYSPPLVPVGAILQVFNPRKHEFTILDADENEMFKIYGPCCFNCCGCCVEVDFTIHALDKDRTEVGLIRREWGGFVRTWLADSDLFGITFPKDLDVRVKAVFLGALFFIEYLYFEG